MNDDVSEWISTTCIYSDWTMRIYYHGFMLPFLCCCKDLCSGFMVYAKDLWSIHCKGQFFIKSYILFFSLCFNKCFLWHYEFDSVDRNFLWYYILVLALSRYMLFVIEIWWLNIENKELSCYFVNKFYITMKIFYSFGFLSFISWFGP